MSKVVYVRRYVAYQSLCFEFVLWTSGAFQKVAHEATDDGEKTMESVKAEEWANMTTVQYDSKRKTKRQRPIV